MPNTTQTWGLWREEVNEYIDEEKATNKTLPYEKLFNVKPTSKLRIIKQGYSGFSPMHEVGEMGDAVENNPRETYSAVYTRRQFRDKTVFSRALWDTDQHDEVKNIATSFARIAPYSRNLNAFGLFRNGFNSANLGPDGKPYVSTGHLMKNGTGTQTNTFTDGVQRPLSYDNAVLLEQSFYNLVGNSGNLTNYGDEDRNKILLVTPANREVAFQIAGVKDNKDEQPQTTDRNKNYFTRGARYDVLMTRWLGWDGANQAGDTTVARSSASNYYDSMWGIIDVDAARSSLNFYYADGYEMTDNDVNKDNQALVYWVYDAYMFGWDNYASAVMSKGDNSTYTG